MSTREDEVVDLAEDLELDLIEDSDEQSLDAALEGAAGEPEDDEQVMEALEEAAAESEAGLVEALDEGEAMAEPDYANLHVSEELLRQAYETADRKRRVETLLASAAAGRAKVPPDIFERVTGDYRRQLEEIAAELGPVRLRIGEELKKVHEQEVRYRTQLETLRANITELKFRSQLGEFTEQDLDGRISELKLVVDALEEQLADFERTYRVVSELLGEDVEALVLAANSASKGAGKKSPAAQRLSPPPPPPHHIRAAGEDPRHQDQTFVPPSAPGARPAPDPRLGRAPAATVVLGRALLTRKRPDGGKAFVIDRNGLILGRSISSDVVIQGATVSRRHALIVFENGRFMIEDVSSGGGVVVNSARITKAILDDGDQIEVGSSLFEFRHG